VSDPVVFDRAIEFLRPLLRDPSQAPEAAARIVAVAEMYIGPIPHPEDFKAYEDAVPGSGKEIILMARREQEHQHKSESLEMLYPYLGLICGFIAF
jgi:uncharacterized membrane protein